MAVSSYIRAFPKVPYDTREYIAMVNGLFADAVTNIGTNWTKDDVQFIDNGSIITMIINSGTNGVVPSCQGVGLGAINNDFIVGCP
jgi:hypothetical protein|tara:strand:+ start:214 stop:471 length:258 start_codon:yes stop_codon:yes gene_type:complete